MSEELMFSANKLVAYLRKPENEFTKADIIKYITENGVRMVNFMYPAGDGHLKTLNFIINDLTYLDTILTCGERVDGSSLFNFITAANSDLYAVPRYRTAFLDPFAEIPTVGILCSFFNKDGKPLESAPEHTLLKASKAFTDKTGMEFHAMGELEYYVGIPDPNVYNCTEQKGYHESAPFSKTGDFRTKCMSYIAQVGGHIKYGHSEVGIFKYQNQLFEQNEIEFLPVQVERTAEELLLAQWVILNLAWRENITVSFGPKLMDKMAGSGLHIHMRFMKKGKNMMLTQEKQLSDITKKAIAGIMTVADAITAFGNKAQSSYERLVPNQEAPTNVCWGISNRSAMVRLPLGWTSGVDLCHQANPQQASCDYDTSSKQTMEIRTPDATADIYQLLASLCVACRYGFEIPDGIEIAERTYVSGDIHKKEMADKLHTLEQLPTNMTESAECLSSKRSIFEEQGIFSADMIDNVITELKAMDSNRYQHEEK